METIDGKMITSETLGGVFSSFHQSDDSQEILKPSSEEKKVGEDLPPENEVLTAAAGGAAAAGDGGGGGGPVVVTTTTVIEKTQISVVIQEVENDDVLNNQEGFFGHLVGGVDDETMEFVDANISFSGENGCELMEEVEKQENREKIVESGVVSEEKKLVFEENVVSETMEVEKKENGAEIFESGVVSEKEKMISEENAVCEPMEVEKQENGAEIVESGVVSEQKKLVSEENVVSEPMEVEKQEIGAEIDAEKNNEGNRVETKLESVEKPDTKPENQENGQDSGNKSLENDNEGDDSEDENEEDHDFVIGDFVWGKIKSHPWWPGQIYDPLDASEYAATLKRKNHLLVAYFGDGSFSWCSPSQLKPFIDSFEEMSNQSDSKKFVNAVQKGLEAVGKLAEPEMSCKCWNFDKNGGGSVAVNSGIKAGVGMPKGNTIKILVDRMNPVEVFRVLKGYATMDPGVKMAELELTVLKSCLTAFYRRKNGQFSLPEYHEPKYIEGLEDGTTRSGFVSDSDFNGPSESGDGNSHQKRKQKSVAELLGDGGEDERKMKKVKTSGGGGSGSRGLKREQKRKPLVVSVSPESDLDSGGIGMEEETMMSSPRQRKKSKYLSPPYTSPIWTGGKLSASSSFKEMKTESSEKVPEMAAKHLEDSLKRSSASGRKSRSHNHRGRPRDGQDSQDSKEDEKTIVDAAVNVNKVLDGLLRAALDPSSFVEKKKKKVPEVSEFISAFRSSVFEDGSNEKKPVSDLELIERKLESIREMVKGCEEGEISEEMKGDLEEGIEEVLEKVKKMK